jgi:hypothetical protein
LKTRLPGQKNDISPELESLARQAEKECERKIEFSGLPMKNFVGRAEWRSDDILVEVDASLTGDIAEYVAAHELGHVLQLARGCSIASGREDEPGAAQIGTNITDFVCDPMADTFASGYGVPMARGFRSWIESTGIFDVLQHPRRGRIYGTDWHRAWEGMTEARVRKQLGLMLPKPTRDFWAIYVALDLAKLSVRATNLGLGIGEDILEGVKKVRLLAAIISDLVDIGFANSIDEKVTKSQAVLDYFKAEPGHIYINRPITNEVLIDGRWRRDIPQTPSIVDSLLGIKDCLGGEL